MGDRILKTRNKPGLKNTSFIGANVPNELYFKMLLYVAAYGVTKNAFIRDTLQSAFNTESTGLSTVVLMDKLINRLKNSYSTKLRIEPTLNIEKFNIQISAELKDKGFQPEMIVKILTQMYGTQ